MKDVLKLRLDGLTMVYSQLQLAAWTISIKAPLLERDPRSQKKQSIQSSRTFLVLSLILLSIDLKSYL
jgi:hypothetical protein